MAKIIYKNGKAIGYEPGIIYDLGFMENGRRVPFYVGETSDKEQREKDHRRAGANADETSTLVYQTIRKMTENGIEWTMEQIDTYGVEGPTDKEDEWIMHHLYDGHKLTNMKKGNDKWLEDRKEVALDMRHRGIRSYKKYKEVITQEDADRKHKKWMAEEARKQLEIDFRAATRKRLAEEAAAVQAEIIRQKEIAKQRAEAAKKIAAEKWEAERPAREARLKAETERKLQEEQRRAEQAAANLKERNRLEEQKRSELQARANLNYSDWPDLEDRLRHQTSEDTEIKIMLDRGYAPEQIINYIEQDRKMHWPPSRVR